MPCRVHSTTEPRLHILVYMQNVIHWGKQILSVTQSTPSYQSKMTMAASCCHNIHLQISPSSKCAVSATNKWQQVVMCLPKLRPNCHWESMVRLKIIFTHSVLFILLWLSKFARQTRQTCSKRPSTKDLQLCSERRLWRLLTQGGWIQRLAILFNLFLLLFKSHVLFFPPHIIYYFVLVYC